MLHSLFWLSTLRPTRWPRCRPNCAPICIAPLIALDTDRIAATIDRAAVSNAGLAAALARYAGRYAYTAIWNALEASGVRIHAQTR